MTVAIIMKQKQQRMMAEATTKSPITVLPEELMIEILSRVVESSNPIQFRCVCKLWKSLLVDPQFANNYLLKSFIELNNLGSKAVKDFTAIDTSEVFDLAVSQEESKEDEEKLEQEQEQKEEEDEEQWMKNGVDWLDKLLKKYRILKVRFETMRDDIQALEDRVKCLRSFMRIYLKSLESS